MKWWKQQLSCCSCGVLLGMLFDPGACVHEQAHDDRTVASGLQQMHTDAYSTAALGSPVSEDVG
jgi:hypothetical protein